MKKNQYSIVELEMIYRFGFVALKKQKKEDIPISAQRCCIL